MVKNQESTERKITAILFADIVGYTSLMQSSEKIAMQALHKFKNTLETEVPNHRGQIINFYGDGCLAVFGSSIEATTCAQKIQGIFHLNPQVPVRIGLHAGDVVFEEGNVFGDAVNITSRIESMGIAGSVLLSGVIKDQINNQEQFELTNIGKFNFKNVTDNMSVYALAGAGLVVPEKISPDPKGSFYKSNASRNLIRITVICAALLIGLYFFWRQLSPDNKQNEVSETLVEKSIAVLPFKNWSGNDSLEYFVDGMTDEVITRLSKVQDLDKVISRTSVFKYKETTKTIPEIASELDVQYILESSFQKVDNQIKIKLTLIEVEADSPIWSDEITGDWISSDVFKIQASVAENVIHNMEVSLTPDEIESIQERPTKNDEAYNIFLQAEFQRNKNDNQSYLNAIPMYEAAIKLDESFILPYLGLADIWQTGGLIWGLFPEQEASKNSKELLSKALKLDPENERAFKNLFGTNFYYHWDFDYCEDNLERYVDFLPNSSEMNGAGDYLLKTGRYDESIKWCDWYSGLFPSLSFVYAHQAKVLIVSGNHEQALNILKSKDPLYKTDQWYLREACWIYLHSKEYPDFKKNLSLLQSHNADRVPIYIWFEAIQAILDHENKEATKLVNEIVEIYQENRSGSPAWFLSQYYFYVDEIETAFIWLQRSYDRHEVEMTWLIQDPLLKPFKNHPIYTKLVNQMKWPKI